MKPSLFTSILFSAGLIIHRASAAKVSYGGSALPSCGVPAIPPLLDSSTLKIIGGIEAIPNSWPWQAAVFVGRGFCGGTILTDRWVLTAAQCCPGNDSITAITRLGTGAHALATSVNYTVGQRVTHPRWDPTSVPFDFCLLQTSTPIQFNDRVSPACLPKSYEPLEAAGTRCYITGWGSREVNGSASREALVQASVGIVDRTVCNSSEIYDGLVTEQMICAGQAGRDACEGDTGGPLVCQDAATHVWTVVGLTSAGGNCAATTPVIFSRISIALDFISSTINQNAGH